MMTMLRSMQEMMKVEFSALRNDFSELRNEVRSYRSEFIDNAIREKVSRTYGEKFSRPFLVHGLTIEEGAISIYSKRHRKC